MLTIATWRGTISFCHGTTVKGHPRVSYEAEDEPRRTLKGQRLLRNTKDGKLWRIMSDDALKGHDTCMKMKQNELNSESDFIF